TPTLPAGRVVITFSIGADGRVKRTAIDDREAPTPELAACVAAASLSWRFPPPDGGAVEVAYPFEFAASAPLAVELRPDGTRRVSRAALMTWASAGSIGANLVPSTANGKPLGMRVYAIAPGSPLRPLGIEDGDLLLRVGGVALTDDVAMLAALTEMFPTATRLDVELRRRDQPMTLRYELTE
ncbi:MAG: AgmX/PglI C-terminal domain-containing protein, partial [Myxococcales bacterium]|nr:AgmX/PglI C-terminal domain-containing protein [Myxococcales bacterium]